MASVGIEAQNYSLTYTIHILYRLNQYHLLQCRTQGGGGQGGTCPPPSSEEAVSAIKTNFFRALFMQTHDLND